MENAEFRVSADVGSCLYHDAFGTIIITFSEIRNFFRHFPQGNQTTLCCRTKARQASEEQNTYKTRKTHHHTNSIPISGRTIAS